MNIELNDFILAIKKYEDIMLSMPVPEANITHENIPELYKIFLTVSTLIRDYDDDFVKLINDKWESLDFNEKLSLVEMVNEGTGSNGAKLNLDISENISDILDDGVN